MSSSNEKRESEVRVRATRDKEREKITKILNASIIVTVHICTVTVAFVHLCTILHPLMWFFFFFLFFDIFQDFASIEVDALRI